jgi:hypothetical protein
MKLPAVAGTSSAALPSATPAVGIIPANPPVRQLSELPKDELNHLAEEFGLDPHDFRTPQHLVTALHERRQAIAAMDREAMLDVIKWGRRPVTYNASKEQIAQEIVRIRSMKFDGLSQRGLVVLATLRGLNVSLKDPVPGIVKKLRKQEGIFSRLNRKRRAMLGSMVSRMIGDEPADDYQFLPSQQPGTTTTDARRQRPRRDDRPAGAGNDQGRDRRGRPARRHRRADQKVRRRLRQSEAGRNRVPHRSKAR